MTYEVQKYHTEIVSWKTGVSPRKVCRWRIVRKADGRVMESNIATRKDAEWRLRGIK